MPRPGLLLPVLQNWSCHNCGGCCREHLIGITAEEKTRIESQNWSAQHGTPTDRPLFLPHGSAWRINHQADGACVFLDQTGLCRIHSRFGEPAKPLACRLYPYAIHPAGHLTTASLRFSCPSVVQNLGSPVAAQRSSIETLAEEVVPSNYRSLPPPPLRSGLAFDWPRMKRLSAWIERGLSDSQVSFPIRLQRMLIWLSLLGQAEEEALSEEHFGDLIKLLYEAAARALPASPQNPAAVRRPSRLARLMLRQFVAQLLRHDTAATAEHGWRGRITHFTHGLRFTLGVGSIPQLPDPDSVRVAFVERAGASLSPIRPVSFTIAEAPLESWDPQWDELFVRYFHVKLQGLHFCGPAFYDYPILAGLQSLALLFPAILWTARLRAAREQRSTIQLRDLQASLAVLDHNYGYSPVLGLRSSQKRIEQLAAMDQLSALVAWYSRTASP
jgi:lysine-N-methylase